MQFMSTDLQLQLQILFIFLNFSYLSDKLDVIVLQICVLAYQLFMLECRIFVLSLEGFEFGILVRSDSIQLFLSLVELLL